MSKTTATTGDFTVPGVSRGLLDVFGSGYLLGLLISQSIKVRYRGSSLGWLWSYVKPATQFVIYYVAFGLLFQMSKGNNYAIYLFAGLIAINFFNEALGNSTASIVSNSALVKKVYLPRELFPISAVFVSFVHFLPQVVILLVGSFIVGYAPTLMSLVAFLFGLLILGVLSTGLGLLFGALNVKFRDAQNFVDLILMVVTWTSPVLYTYDFVQKMLGPVFFELYMSTPITAAVNLFHEAFWAPTVHAEIAQPPLLWLNGLIGLGYALIFLAIGQFVFTRQERSFAQVL